MCMVGFPFTLWCFFNKEILLSGEANNEGDLIVIEIEGCLFLCASAYTLLVPSVNDQTPPPPFDPLPFRGGPSA